MPDILVRNISEETKNLLAKRAAQHGRSVVAEIRSILDEAVEQGSWIRFWCNPSHYSL